jgi:hypothetical protein
MPSWSAPSGLEWSAPGAGSSAQTPDRVDERTNIHVEPHRDKTLMALTTMVDGKPTVTITYSIDELRKGSRHVLGVYPAVPVRCSSPSTLRTVPTPT